MLHFSDISVYKKGESVVAEFKMPLRSDDEIKVWLDESYVYMEGTHREHKEVNADRYKMRERRDTEYSGYARLTAPPNPDGTTARYAHGVLRVTCPIAEKVRKGKVLVRVSRG